MTNKTNPAKILEDALEEIKKDKSQFDYLRNIAKKALKEYREAVDEPIKIICPCCEKRTTCKQLPAYECLECRGEFEIWETNL